ncbi:MAG: SurA N-terminal domain-containing protein [Bacteroidia bacterium]|nr:SurA N-terminal domain-containing protein [Bacteroidia bacterium]
MSILEKIRNRSGLAIVVIGGALVIFVVSDALNSNSRLFGESQPTSVGIVDGKEIGVKAFENKVAENTELTRQQMGPEATMDQNAIDMVREQTWSQLVMEGIMEGEYENLGIKITNEELTDMFIGDNVHPQVVQSFTNPQTGQFDKSMVISNLKQINEKGDADAKKRLHDFESYLLQDALNKKYYALIRKGVYATSLEAKSVYTNRSKTIDVDAVALNYFSVPDSSITATDDDLKSYMNKNSKKYAEKENSRKLEFVVFDAVANASDSSDAEKWVTDQLTQFATATNDTLYVDANSDVKFDPTAKPRSAYPDDVVNRLFRDSVGSIVGPVFSDGKYNIYKVIGTKQDTIYQMRASHILFKTENGDTAATIKKANEVMAEIKGGADFGAMAAQYGTDGTAQRSGDLGWFSEGQMVKEFNDAVLAGNKGDMRVLKTQFGVHILKITEDKTKKLVCAGVLSRSIQPSEATTSTAYNAASQFAASVTDAESFNKVAAEQHLGTRTAEFVRETDKQVGGIMEAREVVRWTFNAQKGNVSDVFSVNDKFIVAVLTTLREKGKPDFETSKPRVDADYRKEKKAEQLLEKVNTALAGTTTAADLAAKLQLSVTPIVAQSFDNNNIAYIGPDNVMVGTMFGTKTIGKLTGPIKGDNAIYVFAVNKINEAPATTDYSIYKGEAQAQLSQRIEYATFETLKELKNVKDNRFRFY